MCSDGALTVSQSVFLLPYREVHVVVVDPAGYCKAADHRLATATIL